MNKGERAALALLVELEVDEAPIDVEDIARRLDVVLTKERLAADLSGLLIRQPGQVPVVGVNTAHHPRRQRFTVAHELGHYRLRHKGEVIVDSGIRVNMRDANSRNASAHEEREANAFAAALLMPAELLQRHLRELVARNVSQTRIVTDLARHFDVSEEAMHYRLLNLGMLSH
jgi:Zn-dependent peptidase ImmA (M78 family)